MINRYNWDNYLEAGGNLTVATFQSLLNGDLADEVIETIMEDEGRHL